MCNPKYQRNQLFRCLFSTSRLKSKPSPLLIIIYSTVHRRANDCMNDEPNQHPQSILSSLYCILCLFSILCFSSVWLSVFLAIPQILVFIGVKTFWSIGWRPYFKAILLFKSTSLNIFNSVKKTGEKPQKPKTVLADKMNVLAQF